MVRRETEILLANFAREHNWKETRKEAMRHGRPNEGSEFAASSSKSIYDRARFLFTLAPEGIARVDLLQAFQAQAEARLAIAAVALHRYSVVHKSYPKSLEAIVPRFIGRVPLDPMDGEPLKYHLLENGKFLLYSSGTDGEDSGGSVEVPEENASTPNLWNTADVIWPSIVQPAT